MSDLDLGSQIEGHMRMRAGPALHAIHNQVEGMEWGHRASPGGELHAMAMAADEGAGGPSIPASPTDVWNADDLIIPGLYVTKPYGP